MARQKKEGSASLTKKANPGNPMCGHHRVFGVDFEGTLRYRRAFATMQETECVSDYMSRKTFRMEPSKTGPGRGLGFNYRYVIRVTAPIVGGTYGVSILLYIAVEPDSLRREALASCDRPDADAYDYFTAGWGGAGRILVGREDYEHVVGGVSAPGGLVDLAAAAVKAISDGGHAVVRRALSRINPDGVTGWAVLRGVTAPSRRGRSLFGFKPGEVGRTYVPGVVEEADGGRSDGIAMCFGRRRFEGDIDGLRYDFRYGYVAVVSRVKGFEPLSHVRLYLCADPEDPSLRESYRRGIGDAGAFGTIKAGACVLLSDDFIMTDGPCVVSGGVQTGVNDFVASVMVGVEKHINEVIAAVSDRTLGDDGWAVLARCFESVTYGKRGSSHKETAPSVDCPEDGGSHFMFGMDFEGVSDFRDSFQRMEYGPRAIGYMSNKVYHMPPASRGVSRGIGFDYRYIIYVTQRPGEGDACTHGNTVVTIYLAVEPNSMTRDAILSSFGGTPSSLDLLCADAYTYFDAVESHRMTIAAEAFDRGYPVSPVVVDSLVGFAAAAVGAMERDRGVIRSCLARKQESGVTGWDILRAITPPAFAQAKGGGASAPAKGRAMTAAAAVRYIRAAVRVFGSQGRLAVDGMSVIKDNPPVLFREYMDLASDNVEIISDNKGKFFKANALKAYALVKGYVDTVCAGLGLEPDKVIDDNAAVTFDEFYGRVRSLDAVSMRAFLHFTDAEGSDDVDVYAVGPAGGGYVLSRMAYLSAGFTFRCTPCDRDCPGACTVIRWNKYGDGAPEAYMFVNSDGFDDEACRLMGLESLCRELYDRKDGGFDAVIKELEEDERLAAERRSMNRKSGSN